MDFEPKSNCIVLQRDGTIWVVAKYWSVENDANVSGEVISTRDAATANAKEIGSDIRAALAKFTVRFTENDAPPDPFEVLSKGKVSKFTKGLMGVFVVWVKEEKVLQISGSFGETGAGLVSSKIMKSLPDTAGQLELGTEVLRQFEKIKKNEGLKSG